MKKKLLSVKRIALAFSVLIAPISFGQLASGTIAPNFTATDINGNTHTLYDYLAQGKTVVLDFSATWCGPCWNYHNAHFLEDVYNNYGPNGTDEMMVFYIESDEDTDMSDLLGLTPDSQGDWVTGTSYPIIDDLPIPGSETETMIADGLFDVGYYPTIFYICPNGVLTEDYWYDSYFSATELHDLAGDCPQPSNGLDLSLIMVDGFDPTCETTIDSLICTIHNFGTTPINEYTLNLYADGVFIDSAQFSDSLSTFQYKEVVFTDVPISSFQTEFTIEALTNGDVTQQNNTIVENFVKYNFNTNNLITVEITADDYPDEIGFRIARSNGTVVSEVLPGNIVAGLNTFQVDLGSAEDCFLFTMIDSYGDGLTESGNYSIKSENGSIVHFYQEGWNYGSETNKTFANNYILASQNLIDESDFQVYPSVTSGIVTIACDENKFGILNVIAASGKLVYSNSVKEGKFNVDLSSLDSGLYFVELRGENNAVRKRIVLID